MKKLRLSGLLLTLAACATTSPKTAPAASYPGRCELLGLEHEELHGQEASDTIALVATYRFAQSSAPRTKPVAFSFRVRREQAGDLREHIIAHPSVLCRPDEPAEPIVLPPSQELGGVAPISGELRPGVRLPDQRDRKVHMGATFWDAVDVRDALLDGDLPRARELARSLRDRDYGDTLPRDWKPFIGDMRKHADQLAMAPDLETAAAELGMISLSCGNCHWFADHGPDPLPEPRVPEPAPGEEQLLDRMTRHALASEQMWEGLIVPSDHAWHSGTLMFTRAPLAAPHDRAMAVDSELHARIEALRGLAREARVATSHKTRAQLYGRMLARCAACHYEQR